MTIKILVPNTPKVIEYELTDEDVDRVIESLPPERIDQIVTEHHDCELELNEIHQRMLVEIDEIVALKRVLFDQAKQYLEAVKARPLKEFRNPRFPWPDNEETFHPQIAYARKEKEKAVKRATVAVGTARLQLEWAIKQAEALRGIDLGGLLPE